MSSCGSLAQPCSSCPGTSLALHGPAYKGGIKVGDIITRVDNLEIDKMIELREYLYSKEPNDTIKLTIIRNNLESIINITLGNKSP